MLTKSKYKYKLIKIVWKVRIWKRIFIYRCKTCNTNWIEAWSESKMSSGIVGNEYNIHSLKHTSWKKISFPYAIPWDAGVHKWVDDDDQNCKRYLFYIVSCFCTCLYKHNTHFFCFVFSIFCRNLSKNKNNNINFFSSWSKVCFHIIDW